MAATYGGVACLGVAVHVRNQPAANVESEQTYMGCDGIAAVFGGSRGGELVVTGCLWGPDIPGLLQAEQVLLSYADGVGRVFTDDVGRVFPNVIFRGQYVPSPQGPKWTDDGVILPYQARFFRLT